MSKSKAKGTAAETAVVKYLQLMGWPTAERRALSGAQDRGDIAGVAGVCIEVKAAEKRPARPDAWFSELRAEMKNADAPYGVLVVKVKYKPTARWDAWMPAGQLGVPVPADEDWTWLRMDLRLAVALMRERGISFPSPRSSSTTAST